MGRTYTRTVSTSAEPSRANWNPGQPRECHHCGETLRITRDNVLQQSFPRQRSFHVPCYRLWLEEHQ